MGASPAHRPKIHPHVNAGLPASSGSRTTLTPGPHSAAPSRRTHGALDSRIHDTGLWLIPWDSEPLRLQVHISHSPPPRTHTPFTAKRQTAPPHLPLQTSEHLGHLPKEGGDSLQHVLQNLGLQVHCAWFSTLKLTQPTLDLPSPTKGHSLSLLCFILPLSHPLHFI